MTILGKILVFVNLVFSLVTGFLIVTVFVTRANWKDNYDKAVARMRAAEAATSVAQADLESARTAAQTEADGLRAEINRQKQALASLQLNLDSVKAARDQANAQLASATTNQDTAATELKRRQIEVDNLTKALAEREAKIVALQKEEKDLRDRTVSAEITANSEHERAQRLLAQVETLSRQADQPRPGGGSSGTAPRGTGVLSKNPPVDPVEGRVTETDARSGLVTISLGTDSGVNVGNTMEVYRLEPATYLGTIRIMDAHPHEAVGQVVGGLRNGPIKKNDTVSSRISAGGR